MTFVRRTTRDGKPLGLWHVARPMRTKPAGCLTGCGRVVEAPWPTAGTGWTYRQVRAELPAGEARCGGNGCRQRWEST